jgi:hypothetical protein
MAHGPDGVKSREWTAMGPQGLTELVITLQGINLLRSVWMKNGDRFCYLPLFFTAVFKDLAAVGLYREQNMGVVSSSYR